ncbi:MAG TPA: hypothetical protein ENG51_01805 [Deltaproteobacteria bacterium]|nr:hypothetical protein [Deltaproteobacteria bacterium]
MQRQGLRSKAFLVLLSLFFKGILDISYVYLVSPFFSWMPSRYPLAVDGLKIFESYLLTFGLSLVLPTRVRKPSDFLIALLFIVPVLPTLSLYGLMDGSRTYTYMLVIAFIIVRGIPIILPLLKIRLVRGGNAIAAWSSIFGVVAALVLLMTLTGLHFFTLNILDIQQLYTTRERVVASLTKGGLLLNYLQFWAFYVFMPILILSALHYRRYGLFAVLIALQLLFLGLSARRGVLLATLILLGTFVIVERRSAITIMIGGFLAMVVISFLVAIIGGQFLPGSLIIGRFFFTPARLNYAYHEFFSKAGFVYLTSTKLPIPLEYPFSDIPERLIGKEIFHSKTVASAGWLATSYMHFGYLGMILFAIIIGLLLKIIDSLIYHRMSLRFGVPLAAIPFYSLFTSADLTTALLTYGILPIMIMLWFLGSPRIAVYQRNEQCKAVCL